MNKQMKISLLAGLFVLTGCASGSCKNMQNKNRNSESEIAMENKLNQQLSQKVRVFQYDGTKQCGEGKEISLVDMAKQLGDIKVYSSKKINDGKMRIQMCGAENGMANVYEIDRNDLSKAIEKGFREWTFD